MNRLQRPFYCLLILILSVLACDEADLTQTLNDITSDDYAGMVLIPAGEVTIGNPNALSTRPAPVRSVHTDAYWIDTHEVSYAEFKAFMEDTSYSPASLQDHERAAQGLSIDTLPAVVTWKDASAYADWIGKRLPTEIEWEKAARGGLENKRFSWGDATPTLAEQQEIIISYLGSGQFTQMAAEGAFVFHPFTGRDVGGSDGDSTGSAFTFMPVGSYAPNGYGLYDVIGNAAEFCQERWEGNYYKDPYSFTPPEATPPVYVVRGGGSLHSLDAINSWEHQFDTLPAELQYRYARRTIHIGERAGSSWAGFRLVRDP
ncbi:MAG: SUMF1/EgtB/PvdO family nonheme iron enzyme [Candidatus Poribacteria bacterium]|nr:SUMF1/EgtB/PvdO family nonheme iron enzyme [Candidatus Poribacteria bacterium]